MSNISKPYKTRMDWYLNHPEQNRYALRPTVRCIAHDGNYQKIKFVDGVVGLGLHGIGKLRCDSNPRYLYYGPQKPLGRKRKYDGKVRFDDLNRFESAAIQDNQRIHTTLVDSVGLKRNIRIVYIVKQAGKKISTALLFSTDINLPAVEIHRFYKARFQIEFPFRDAKQFTGLLGCQTRCEQRLHFHFNALMTALNLIKMKDRQPTERSDGRVISVLSWKIRKFNEHLLERFSSKSGLNLTLKS
jgi:IS4 transposase